MKEEAATHTHEIWWKAELGDAGTLRKFAKESPTGYATGLLDWLEMDYAKYWRPE